MSSAPPLTNGIWSGNAGPAAFGLQRPVTDSKSSGRLSFDNEVDEWERTDFSWTRDIKKAMKQYIILVHIIFALSILASLS